MFREEGLDLASVPLTDGLLQEVDLVIITTAHSNVDYEHVVRLARMVLDTKNATKKVPGREGKVVLL